MPTRWVVTTNADSGVELATGSNGESIITYQRVHCSSDGSPAEGFDLCKGKCVHVRLNVDKPSSGEPPQPESSYAHIYKKDTLKLILRVATIFQPNTPQPNNSMFFTTSGVYEVVSKANVVEIACSKTTWRVSDIVSGSKPVEQNMCTTEILQYGVMYGKTKALRYMRPDPVKGDPVWTLHVDEDEDRAQKEYKLFAGVCIVCGRTSTHEWRTSPAKFLARYSSTKAAFKSLCGSPFCLTTATAWSPGAFDAAFENAMKIAGWVQLADVVDIIVDAKECPRGNGLVTPEVVERVKERFKAFEGRQITPNELQPIVEGLSAQDRLFVVQWASVLNNRKVYAELRPGRG